MCEDPIDLPIPRLYELLEFEYNDEYYFPRVNTKAELLEEIQTGKIDLENAETLFHIV